MPTGKTKQIKEGLADLAQRAEMDHEVQMARADLYKIAKYAIKLHDMLKGVSEEQGIEGWQQSKITKAADYMGSVYHAMDYDVNFAKDNMGISEKKKYKKNYTYENDSYKLDLSNKLSQRLQESATDVCSDCGNPSWRTLGLTEAELESYDDLEEGKKKGKDGKACWKGYRYAGTEDGKDKCIKVKRRRKKKKTRRSE